MTVHPSTDAHRDDSDAQYVTFRLGAEVFAFPMEAVREIIRPPPVVRLPRATAALEGVANLRGQVLPVVNLGQRLGLAAGQRGEGARVVVVEDESVIGFVVDSVASVVTATRAQHEALERLPTGLDAGLLRAMLKDVSGIDVALVLDVSALVQGAARSPSASAGATAVSARPAAAHASGQAPAERELVSFFVDGQEYAFDVDRVQEIVHAPATLTRLPNAPPHVLGLMTLRGQLVPLVGLRGLLGAGAPPPGGRVVIVSVEGGVLGFVSDSVREVLRVPRGSIEPVPVLVEARERGAIEGVCRLTDGARLVTVLSIEALLRGAMLGVGALATPGTSAAPGQEGNDVMAHDERQFVAFRLGGVEYAVDIERVREIVRVPDVITRVPHSPPHVAGVVTIRGEVMPVVDLRAHFGLEPGERDTRQRIVILSSEGRQVGFVVDSVSKVLKVPASTLEPVPGAGSSEAARAVQQVVNLGEKQHLVLVLEAAALLDDGATAAELAKAA